MSLQSAQTQQNNNTENSQIGKNKARKLNFKYSLQIDMIIEATKAKLTQQQQNKQKNGHVNNSGNKINIQNQQQSSKDVHLPQNIFICFLCEQLIIHAVQANCGHAFCQYCLSQYFLVARECPICQIKIRQKKGAANKALDQLIQQFSTFMNEQDKDFLNMRKQQRKIQRQNRKIDKISSGELVDIRDDEYIWRKGRILRTFNRINGDQVRVKFVVVQYFQSQKKQEFPISCLRLAKAGYYTNRKYIPKYKDIHVLNQYMEQQHHQKQHLIKKINENQQLNERQAPKKKLKLSKQQQQVEKQEQIKSQSPFQQL